MDIVTHMPDLHNVVLVIPTLVVICIHIDGVDGEAKGGAVDPGVSVPARTVGRQDTALHRTGLLVGVAVDEERVVRLDHGRGHVVHFVRLHGLDHGRGHRVVQFVGLHCLHYG